MRKPSEKLHAWLLYEPNPVAPPPPGIRLPHEPAVPEPLAATREWPLRFTGTGAAYFRIWVVHTLLTVLSLGLYSPWAKVRKMRWFAQHTRLAEDGFDFHGKPWRILLGRLVALVLLVLWTLAFDFGVWLAVAVLGLFCVLGPVLFASAQRFRLANSSWRGVRFDFVVPPRRLYAVCVPLLLLWTFGTAAEAFGWTNAVATWVMLLPALCLPWAHARLKHLQHAHARFGSQAFSYGLKVADFYGLYVKGLVLLVLGAVAAGLLTLLVNHVLGGRTSAWVTAAGTAAMLWLMAWPYFAARLQQVVWGSTQVAGLHFRSEMRGGTLWRLVCKHTLGVVFTAGLWWPFAAVAIARYRLESLVVLSDGPLPVVQATNPGAGAQGAAGDGAADFFGLDIGL